MKTWTDLSKIEQPARIAAMQKDERGYPIPHSVAWVDGKPDFRVIDPNKWIEAVNNYQCGICGQKLEGEMAFVGGPVSIHNRLFTDLPMHKDCAEYALKTCPYLAAPKFGHASLESLAKHGGWKPGEMTVAAAASDVRPSRFGLGVTSGFQLARLGHTGDIVIMANEFTAVSWWRNGEQV